MPYWACARFEPCREQVAKHFLRLAGYAVYIPQIRELKVKGGRRREVISALFPAYGFLAIVEQWHRARWCIGVSALIMAGDGPARVPDTVIASLRSREVGGLIELPREPKYRTGDRLRVTAGPLAGLTGLYAGMKPHERIEVLLAILGGEQRVTLAVDAVESA
jgi:transcriptional antiterminator RfaH